MYELDDHLLIRDDKVIAVSANERFTDGDNPIHPQKGDTIAFVTSALGTVAYENGSPYSDEIEKRREEERLSIDHIQHDPEIPCGEAELVFRTQSEQRMRDAMLVDTTAQVVETCPTCGTIIEDESWG